ncbi:hypothetical protein N7471_009229 [Penicillium samsonianum]|uniref:uncharacterized protein n=1 Tax=Penicillium samsonianum TaxID=1882272 RepID=UPI002547E112|nr:uncharacterized protein N7471_009229 [Penicillium samsonianum]KAJ6128012.1 hypothetical protein N7471_009229 [Penicillium samsonianum]
MKSIVIFLGILTLFSRTVVAVVGGSILAHCYEAIYLYYGYLADLGINGDSRTLGTGCHPSKGTVCTVWEFIDSIETRFDAAKLGDGGTIGATTRPGDLEELADTMAKKGFNRYNDYAMFGGPVFHSQVLLKATKILNDARNNHPNVLQGGILGQAKKALLYAQGEREQDTLASKRAAVQKDWGREDLVIVEKQVVLEGGVTFQDIDWRATAEASAIKSGKEFQRVLAGFVDFSRTMSRDEDVDAELRKHLRIVQSIRTQSDSLGSLAACKALE